MGAECVRSHALPSCALLELVDVRFSQHCGRPWILLQTW